MLTTVFCFFIAIIVLVGKYLRRSCRILRLVPGPPGLPVIGNIPEIFYKNSDDLFTMVRQFSKNYPIYRLSLGPVDIINIVNPEDMEQILSNYKHLSKSKLYSYFNSWLGTGLLTSTGEKWHRRRKLLTPAFHFKILQEFFMVFREETEKAIKKIEEGCCEDAFLDIMPIVTQFTLQTIGETAMGFSDADESFLNIYKKNVLKMGQIVINRVTRPWCDNNFVYSLTKLARNEKRIVRLLHKFSHTVIKNRKEINSNNSLSNTNDTRRKKRLLDLLLEAKEKGANIDDEGIREEVDTFMFEGHDTTAAALSLIMMMLANNPEEQDRAAAEVMDIIGDKSDITYYDIQKFQYLDQCIKEGLRLYPSVPMISRRAGCDFVTSSGYRIPTGTTLHLHIFDLHRKEDIYPDPEKFDPSRFSKKNIAERHPYAYLPFSAGPRNCIGQKFAMLEMKTFLVGILKRFKLEAVTGHEEIVLESDFVLKTSNPIMIKFTERRTNQ